MTGKIVKVFGRFYTVKFENRFINCTLRGKIKLGEDYKRFSNPVAVGDMVDFTAQDDGGGTIDSIHKRKNIFSRMDKLRGKEDLIASNLDQIVVVQSYTIPSPSTRFVDRILVRGKKEGIHAVLCINKSDIKIEEEEKYIRDYYNNADIEIFSVSAKTGESIGELRKNLAGKTSIFIGNSGVGKSSLLNMIFPDLLLRINEVSESSGKGRHTTTNVEMVDLGADTGVVDTPGFRAFGLMDIEPEELAGYFPEFSGISDLCAFRPCTHDHEPRCEIKKLVESGEIFYDRYVSYINILNSLRHYQDTKYE